MLGLSSKSSTYIISLVVHLLVLVPMVFIATGGPPKQLTSAIETFFDNERPPDEFTRELDTSLQVAETTNAVAGAVMSGAGGVSTGGGVTSGGGGGLGGAGSKIEGSGTLGTDDAVIQVGLGNAELPGTGEVGADLGEGVVKGEPQAAAGGYGEAMDRVSQEILRMMREEKILVVWLFDESGSMKDDQEEIKGHFRKIYAELGIQQQKDQKLKSRSGDETLLTAVHSFGLKVQKLTAKPTAEDKEVMRAIDNVPVDESGKENTCTAIQAVLDEYRPFKIRSKRKVVVIVVTDESGDDGEGKVEETIQKAKAIKAPIFVMGRESIFGYTYARIVWRDPKYNLPHWLNINRGPESAYYEALQFDGLHDRWDAHPSGFAPYDQARLCRDTGGIFFVLPHEEQNLSGAAAVDKRKFEFLDMKQYVPELIPRKEYVEVRSKSKFREAIFEVARSLDPRQNEKMNVQEHWYSAEKAKFSTQGQEGFNRSMNNLVLLDAAVAKLESVKRFREKEESQRWRANYDLALAQVKAYRVRAFQYLLIMDNQLNNFPMPKDPKHNVWNLIRTKDVLTPTDRQVKLTKIDLAKLRKQEEEARAEFAFVIKTHPRTPWANRAEYELNQGFGWRWQSEFRDPRYDTLKDIKIPIL